MLTLVVKQLTEFQRAVRRDVIADGLSRPKLMPDKELLKRLVDYGNAFLDRAQDDPANRDAVIWFDINFGDPAVVGMTWAYNPFNCDDPKTNAPFFWRIWSETDPVIGSLPQVQEEFAAYCVQRKG